jgi:hypothetical protein
MAPRLMTYCGAAGLLMMATSASIAQIGPSVDVGPYGPSLGTYGPRYSGQDPYYFIGPDYYGSTQAIYGGPSGDLFSYQGPNRAAMEHSDR